MTDLQAFSLVESGHDTCVCVPAQQWILAAARLGLLNFSPIAKKIFLRMYTRRISSNVAVNISHDRKFGRKENVKVTLLNLVEGGS